MAAEDVPFETDNGGSEYDGLGSMTSSVIWGLSCGVVSTIAVKAIEAWTCAGGKRNPQKQQVPAINYIVPSNCHSCSSNAQSSSQNSSKTGGGSSPIHKDGKENSIAAPSRVIGHDVPCSQLASLFGDCRNNYAYTSDGRCELYSDLLQKCINRGYRFGRPPTGGKGNNEQESSAVAPTELLLNSFQGCCDSGYSGQEVCRRKYGELLDAFHISTSN